MADNGALLWSPGAAFSAGSNISRFIGWLDGSKGLSFTDYHELWQWSVDDLGGFWEAVWEYFAVQSHTPYECVLCDPGMPGGEWFRGARLNFAEHVLRNETPHETAIYACDENGISAQITWTELAARVRRLATALRAMGVGPGDRVVSYMPNIPEAAVALLATASIGAIFSSCSPDFGTRSVIDRFGQIAPKVLLCVDGYRYGGKAFDRRKDVKAIIDGLPSLQAMIAVSHLLEDDDAPAVASAVSWRTVMGGPAPSRESFHFEQVDFSHPLWILYSSGTTGLPKAIVHGHGGIVLEYLKFLGFHMNLGPGSRMLSFATTGWVVWNALIGAMLTGASVVLFDGNPMAREADLLWRVVEESGTTFFGTSPTYIRKLAGMGIVPARRFRFARLEGVLLTGSPATPEVMKWCYENVKADLWVTSQSGGTDIASAFVGGSPTLPVYAGEIQARCLGVDAAAASADGKCLVGEIGELVIRQPMPSMPLCFWSDTDNRRYTAAYFEQFPGWWCHGDYFLVNDRGGCYIQGRSDATLNRDGVRIGTAEIYRALAALDEIDDSLVVNLDQPDGRSVMMLFVKLADDLKLSADLAAVIRAALRQQCSPRHVPDSLFQVDQVPYTLTSKKMEVPVRKILMGVSPAEAASRDAMANPDALDYFIALAAAMGHGPATPAAATVNA